MGRDGTAQISGEEHGAEYRGPRQKIEQRADQKYQTDPDNDAFRVAQLQRGVDDDTRFEQLHDAVDQEEQCWQGGQDPTGPKPLAGHGAHIGWALLPRAAGHRCFSSDLEARSGRRECLVCCRISSAHSAANTVVRARKSSILSSCSAVNVRHRANIFCWLGMKIMAIGSIASLRLCTHTLRRS